MTKKKQKPFRAAILRARGRATSAVNDRFIYLGGR